MAELRSIEPGKYNAKLAQALRDFEEFKKPEWVNFVKSGSHKIRPIHDPEFWHKRSAGILRQLYVRGIVGVGRLRSRYGGRKNNGMAPDHFRKSSGKIIRLMLQQAETAGLVEKVKDKRAGRQLTLKGRQLLEKVAA